MSTFEQTKLCLSCILPIILVLSLVSGLESSTRLTPWIEATRRLGLKSAGGQTMVSTYAPSRKVILCIDDYAAILGYEKALLERSGYVVLTAASAQQGLRLVTKCKCDAVLLDYGILEMSGHEIALEIKLARPELKVILLSDIEVPVQALALVDACVPKLEASRHLLPTIAELCNQSQGATG
jgi:CheY-like chemotaxis protein